jgi:hypothetical protein
MVSWCSVASAAPEFLSYEGKNSIHDGQGGERKTVGGVDFWMRGEPPRRYQVIGSLTDERHKTGLWGAIRMSALDDDIAKSAKAAGGDAVILDGENDEVTGVVGSSFGDANGTYGNGTASASGSSFGFRRATKEHDSRYLVIRYLPDPTPTGPAPTMPPVSPP